METSTWLSHEQMTILRNLLERMREEMRAGLGSSGDEIHRLRLANVQSALMRVEGGTYGECAGCEEPLPFERLRERPEATMCGACLSERRS